MLMASCAAVVAASIAVPPAGCVPAMVVYDDNLTKVQAVQLYMANPEKISVHWFRAFFGKYARELDMHKCNIAGGRNTQKTQMDNLIARENIQMTTVLAAAPAADQQVVVVPAEVEDPGAPPSLVMPPLLQAAPIILPTVPVVVPPEAAIVCQKATNDRRARMAETLVHHTCTQFVAQCLRGVASGNIGASYSSAVNVMSVSGVIPPTNAATSIWAMTSPVTKLFYSADFKPVNRYDWMPALDIDKLDPSAPPPSNFDLVKEYRTMKSHATNGHEQYLKKTGANAPRRDQYARSNPSILYWLMLMGDDEQFCAAVHAAMPQHTSHEAGVGAAPVRASVNPRTSAHAVALSTTAAPPDSPNTKRMKLLTTMQMTTELIKAKQEAGGDVCALQDDFSEQEAAFTNLAPAALGVSRAFPITSQPIAQTPQLPAAAPLQANAFRGFVESFDHSYHTFQPMASSAESVDETPGSGQSPESLEDDMAHQPALLAAAAANLAARNS